MVRWHGDQCPRNSRRHEGLQQLPLLYVSAQLESNRAAYYDHLLAVSLRGDFAAWIEFFVAQMAGSARTTAAKIQRLLAILGAFRDRLRPLTTPGP